MLIMSYFSDRHTICEMINFSSLFMRHFMHNCVLYFHTALCYSILCYVNKIHFVHICAYDDKLANSLYQSMLLSALFHSVRL